MFLRLFKVSPWLNPLNNHFCPSNLGKFELTPFRFEIDWSLEFYVCILIERWGKYVHMLRAQAITALEEVVANDLIDTAWVSIEEIKAGSFELRVKGNFNRSSIALFREKNNIVLEENNEKDWLSIY